MTIAQTDETVAVHDALWRPGAPRFLKAHKAVTKLRMALAGPSGSGKTWSALTIAGALGERIAVIDTEHGAASHYADSFDFDTLMLTSFHPDEYIQALEAAAAEGYQVVIIDSLSHAWFGKDGELELVDRAAKRSQSKNTYFAWREVTPLHNKLVEAMLQSPCHVLVTLRTKTEYIIETDQKGKQVPRKIGMAPIQRDGLEYEFDVVADLDLAHTLVVAKARLHAIADLVVERPGHTFGQQIAQALSVTGSKMRTPVETVNTATGELDTAPPSTPAPVETPRPPLGVIDDPTEVHREALKLEIKVAMAEVLRPLKHTGVFKAVIYYSFGCAWDVLCDQHLAVLEQGIALFRHLCAELGTQGLDVLGPDAQGKPTLAPDQWVAQEMRYLARQAQGDAPTDDPSPVSGVAA